MVGFILGQNQSEFIYDIVIDSLDEITIRIFLQQISVSGVSVYHGVILSKTGGNK